jgi:NAD(P)-dependent dehydrogenase (short-subunit alcohol dehydrogenase family)
MKYVITGANRGLGLELTTHILSQGHKVTAWVRNPERATDLNTLRERHSDALTIQKVDLSSADDIAEAGGEVSGPVDVLVNNAGVLLDRETDFNSLTRAQLEGTFAINTFAPLHVVQSLLFRLKQSSAPLILNISSHMGSIGNNQGGGTYAYRMSKAALNMFTKNFSGDFPSIKILCAHPGWVQTDMGGASAPTTKEMSASLLLKILEGHQQYPSGSFVNYKGQIINW